MAEAIPLRVGCEFRYGVRAPSPAVVQVGACSGEAGRVLEESWAVEPASDTERLTDLYGNALRRLVLPAGDVRLRYSARLDVPGGLDEVDPGAAQDALERLPAEALHYLLASRYCQSDTLRDRAWALFSGSAPGWPRAQAVCDWVHRNVEFEYGASDASTGAAEVYQRRRGVCRDFAHLFISFCRALGLPTRYVAGYLPDLFVEPSPLPMDFAAWAEVYLGRRWWTFDPRNNRPRAGRVVIGRGRDATDVAMVTTWGPADLRDLTVWADVAPS